LTKQTEPFVLNLFGMVAENNDNLKCLWDNGCDNNHSCAFGTYCQIHTGWSQCLEVPIQNTGQSDHECIGLINGADKNAKHGCNDQTPCCNPGAMCYSDGHCHLPCGYTSVTRNSHSELIMTSSNHKGTRDATKYENDVHNNYDVACLGGYCVNDATNGPHCEAGSRCVESAFVIDNYCRENKIEAKNAGCAFTVDVVQDFTQNTINYECKSNTDCCNPDAHCVIGKGSSTGVCSLSCSANYAQYHGYTVRFNPVYSALIKTTAPSAMYLTFFSVLMGLVLSGIIIYFHHSSLENGMHKRAKGGFNPNEKKKREKNSAKANCNGDDFSSSLSITVDDQELR
jgi:hypothetical protein